MDYGERIPVIEFWGVLLVPFQGDVTDRQASALVDSVLARIRRSGANGLALDLSGMSVVDSHLCSLFATLAASANLMGTRTILCGLSPEIAMTLQTMGVELRGVEVTLTLEHALRALGLAPAKGSPAERLAPDEGPGASTPNRTEAQKLADAMLARSESKARNEPGLPKEGEDP